MDDITKYDKRITIRPTNSQYERINRLFMNSSQYKTLSEMIRAVLELGMNELEPKINLVNYKQGIEK